MCCIHWPFELSIILRTTIILSDTLIYGKIKCEVTMHECFVIVLN